jgi:hypothetical protein
MKNLLKTIAILTIFATSFNSFSAEIQCIAKSDSLLRSYPITKEGVEIAKLLKVKTCGGDRFQIAAAQNGHTIKLVKVSPAKFIEVMSKN